MNNIDHKIEYSLWRDEYRSILETLAGKRIIFSYSGGKDSSLALDFMLRAGSDLGFQFEAHAAAFPQHRYTEKEKNRLESYWNVRGVAIRWHELKETDEHIKMAENPCHACQKLRKDLLQSLVKNEVDDLNKFVLVITYSLWDIVGYSIEHILSDIFSGSKGGKGAKKSRRFIETAQRFFPLLKMKEGYTVFRPLIKYNGSDILFTLGEIGIPVLSISCDFRDFRPKRLLEGYYEKMGLRFDYKSVFNFAKEALDLPDISSYESINKEKYLGEIF